MTRAVAHTHSSGSTLDGVSPLLLPLGGSDTIRGNRKNVELSVALEFGHTPKGLQRLARHQRARRLILNGYPVARVATEAGYADQSHLQREWRSFAMQTPTESKRSEYFSPPIPN
jgi:methylphosphotriester-DNA--protein-cysteine methyltransferase